MVVVEAELQQEKALLEFCLEEAAALMMQVLVVLEEVQTLQVAVVVQEVLILVQVAMENLQVLLE